ncbi:Laccase-3 [Cardamine amara subsp. amara]|uniref:Laccase n=1 Tax=Cardamine amara subsp. amara TaxID=228776 RepID=A0ABD1ADJ1_CARAN
MESHSQSNIQRVSGVSLIFLFVCCTFLVSLASAELHVREFVIEAKPVKRLCRTHQTITVNGQFPGPTLEVRNGDSLAITVINKARYNISLHWHGLRQLRNPWADGPEYITQCPIQPGQSYTYRIKIEDQEGTLWWHAHSHWLRATVYGALIIYPRLGSPYPFSMPKRDIPLILGEWWDRNPMDVLRLAQFTGAAPNVSDAYTINGQPGDLYRCSRPETLRFPIIPGETVQLRLINAALNQELFFTVANHQLTVVEVDSAYTKPFITNVVMLGPGQTTNVLITANQRPGRYYIAARAYNSANAPFDNTTTTAILEYTNAPSGRGQIAPVFPVLPGFNDTATATAFVNRLRYWKRSPVPLQINENLFFAVGLGLINCTNPNSPRCQGPNGTRFAASMNNISFVLPRSNSVMQAYYQGIPGIITTDFPPVPPVQFDYTGNVSRGLWQPVKATKAYKLKYMANVQIVLQDTSIVTPENHPMHLHGYQFYVVGSGFGNFDPNRDPANFNLFDPPERNTIGTPTGGWVAIRFVADNPGAWFMHCHIDSHLGWGLAMVFLVENGQGQLQSVQPPPLDLPRC